MENNRVSLYKYVFSPNLPPTLAIVGLVQVPVLKIPRKFSKSFPASGSADADRGAPGEMGVPGVEGDDWPPQQVQISAFTLLVWQCLADACLFSAAMQKDIEKTQQELAKRFVSRPRHTIEV